MNGQAGKGEKLGPAPAHGKVSSRLYQFESQGPACCCADIFDLLIDHEGAPNNMLILSHHFNLKVRSPVGPESVNN